MQLNYVLLYFVRLCQLGSQEMETVHAKLQALGSALGGCTGAEEFRASVQAGP